MTIRLVKKNKNRTGVLSDCPRPDMVTGQLKSEIQQLRNREKAEGNQLKSYDPKFAVAFSKFVGASKELFYQKFQKVSSKFS